MAPSDPHLLVFMPCVICSPWVWAVPSGFLLMNRGQQKWWDVISKIRFQKDLLPSYSWSLAFWHPCSEGASCHIVSSSLERSTCNWERSPSEQPAKNWIPTTITWASLEKDLTPHLPSQAFRWDQSSMDWLTTSLLGMLSQRHPANMGPDSGSTESMR